jgi:hypothetical protein
MENQPQNDPLYSLGGYCSSTAVPSGMDENLFSLISSLTIETDKPTYICVVLKNTLDVEVSNVEIYLDSDDFESMWSKYYVAIAEPLERQFEHINGIYERPKYAEFENVDGESQKITIAYMQPGEMFGLWIERSINQNAEEIENRNNCKWLFDHRNDKKKTRENVDLVINFTPQ